MPAYLFVSISDPKARFVLHHPTAGPAQIEEYAREHNLGAPPHWDIIALPLNPQKYPQPMVLALQTSAAETPQPVGGETPDGASIISTAQADLYGGGEGGF